MPLIDTEEWKPGFIPIKQLVFHPANPRLPELPPNASEREIIHEMCKRSKVDIVARSIADKAYFRNDRLIVLRENNKNVVYEGNRRLCALKVLVNPELAPSSTQRSFKKLSERAGLTSSFKVAVGIVPNRFHAEIVMYSKHSQGQFVVPWEPVQQASFIAAKLDQGETIDDIGQTYGIKKDEIIRAKATIDLYRLARLAPLSDKAKKTVEDPGNFPFSTVYERLIEPKKSGEALGVKITDSGLLVQGSVDDFLLILGQILDDAADNVIDTRKLHKETDQVSYVRGLKVKKGKGSFTVDEAEKHMKAGGSRVSPSQNSGQQSTSRPLSVRSSNRLFSSTVIIGYHHVKLEKLVRECKSIKVSEYPHAAAYLLRATLECALTSRLIGQKLYGKVTVRNVDLGPSLKDMLDYCRSNPNDFQLNAQQKKSLDLLCTPKKTGGKMEIDLWVHNENVHATDAAVIAARECVMPLIKELLRSKDGKP